MMKRLLNLTPILCFGDLLILAVLAYCAAPGSTAQSTPISLQLASSPVATTAHPAASVLPAPLFFLSDQGQIMRLAADGVTLPQITQETAPVTGFDKAIASTRNMVN